MMCLLNDSSDERKHGTDLADRCQQGAQRGKEDARNHHEVLVFPDYVPGTVINSTAAPSFT